MVTTLSQPFFATLEQRARRIDSLLCVGIDPPPELFADAAAVEQACCALIDATRDTALCFKPNSAFFEVWGGAGFDVLARVIAYAGEVPVILDAKRGDIASTAAAYAVAAFERLGAGAITLSPYLGRDGIEPFLAHAGRGVFVLCRTSNPSAGLLQDLIMSDQRLYEHVAVTVGTWPETDRIGLVVGATDTAALARVRAITSEGWLLVPGIGAQGGDLAAVVHRGKRRDGSGLVITVSRAIAQATDPARAALAFRDAIRTARDTA